MKQFDLTLTNNDIWSSSLTLSDLVSDPEKYQIDFYEYKDNVDEIAVDAYELSMRLNSSSVEEQQTVDFSKVAAYVSPEPLPEEISEKESYREGRKVCAMSMLFQNYGFNSDYVNLAGPRAFMGLTDSAIFCSGPARLMPIAI